MLLELALVSIFVLIIGLLLTKLNIPLIAAYVLSGLLAQIILQVFFRGSVSVASFSSLADIGVVLLMFTLGVEFPLKKVFRLKSRIVYLTILQVLLCSAVLSVIFIVFKYQINSAIVFGILFAFSSTVIVAKFLSEHGLVHEEAGEMSLGILILQDMLIIPVSILLPLFFEFAGHNLTFALNLFFVVLKSGLIFGLVILITSRIMPFVLKKVSHSSRRDLLLLSIICLSLLMSSLAKELGFPLSVGAFLAGATVSLTTEKYEIFSEIRPLRDIFAIVFFVFLGFSLDLGYVFGDIFRILFFSLMVLVTKIIVVYLLSIKFEIHPKVALKTAINISGVSEFAFILSSIYFKNKWLKEDDYKMIVAVTLITIMTSPFLFKKEKIILEKFKSFFETKNKPFLFAKNLDEKNHIVLCGYGRIGSRVVKNLLSNGIPFIVVDDDKKRVETIQAKGLNAVYGDATEIEILNFAGIRNAKAVIIALPDRFSQEAIITHSIRLNPKIIVFGRAHENSDKQYLYALGARYVLYPEFEGAMALSKRILKLYKVDDVSIDEVLKRNFEDEKII